MHHHPLTASKWLNRRVGSRAALALTYAAAVLVGCSSDEGGTSNPGGAAGTSTVAGGGNASAGTGTTTAGSTAGGTTSSGGGGTGGASAGTGGAPQGGGGTGGASAGAGGGGTGGSSAGAGGGGAGGGSNEPFALKSSAFNEGQQIPLKYKCAEVNPMGENLSPPLSWGPGPAGTKSYAIVMGHVPTPEHWAIWDIPANVLSLPENIEHKAQPAQPAGSKQSAVNLDGFNGSGYLGPCPQAFNSTQSYKFTLYALDVETVPNLTDTSNPTQAANEIKKHLVAGSQGVSLTGTQIRTN